MFSFLGLGYLTQDDFSSSAHLHANFKMSGLGKGKICGEQEEGKEGEQWLISKMKKILLTKNNKNFKKLKI